jgi:hypothetical protein
MGCRRAIAVALTLVIACGGQSVETVPGANAPASEAGQQDGDACACPSTTPHPDDDCDCPGLSCSFPGSFIQCWDGHATCSQGSWRYEYRRNTECPAQIGGYCTGAGRCDFMVDVGCGPALAEFTCTCTDASWMLAYPELPTLCDCTAITSERLCSLYGRDCSWSDSDEAPGCRPEP